MRRGASRAIAAIVGVVVLALTGCAAIPQSGPVHAANAAAGDDSVEVDILARGPEKGATQEEILAGFIDASASPQGDFEIARKFLTTSFKNEWNPNAGAIVDRGVDRQFTATGETSMTASVVPVAEVSVNGQYGELTSSAAVPLPYEFQDVGGEWRISRAPEGIVIDRNTFSLVFGAYALYFYDPSYTYLVPDLRYFARRISTPTAIVRELLIGPSPWLTGAVVSAFPEGTRLTAPTVQVVARAAQVDLGSDALQADQATLRLMKRQLVASLRSVPSVDRVVLSSNGVEQEVPDPDAADVDPGIDVDSRALVLRGGVFGYLAATGDAIEQIPGISETVAALAPAAVTLGKGAAAAAVLSAAGASVVRSGDPAVTVDDRPGLIDPVMDENGIVWTVPADDPRALQAIAADGTTTSIETHWPDDATRIVSLRLSRDGTRVIALLDVDGRGRFVAAAVLRDEQTHVPVRLGETIDLATAVGAPLDAAWIDELSVVALTALPGGGTALVSQQIGGPSVPLDGSDDSISVSAGNTVRDLRLLGVDGELEQRRGIGWQPRIDGVVLVATQQGL